MKEWKDKTLWQALKETTTESPDSLAIIYLHERMTYKELTDRAEKLSIGLLKLGVRKGDKVAVWSPSCAEWVIAKFAVACIGAVLVPISTRFKTQELSYILSHSDSSTVIIGERLLTVDFSEIIREVLPEAATSEPGKIQSEHYPSLKNIICFGKPKYRGMFEYRRVEEEGEDLSFLKKLDSVSQSVRPGDPAIMLYTSGTTGMPKGVLLSHFLLSNAFYVGEELRLNHEDRLLLYLPFNHCFALINGICGSVTHGCTLVLMDPFDAEESLRTIEEHRVTILFGVPTMYLMQIEHPNFQEYDVSSLRIGMIGGAGAPPAMIQKIMDKMGMGLISTYGMTETSCAVTQTRYGDSARLVSQTVGQALPNMEMKVINTKTKKEVQVGEEGEICIRGYSLTKGYYKNEEETKKLFDEDGWLHSGDLGTVDSDDYFRITGRIKELIIRGGENIAPAEIESFIYQHRDVQQVQIFGIPDEKYGEAVAAAIIRKPESSLTADDIISFCKGKIASYKIPIRVVFVDQYPVTTSGKIKKFELKKMIN